MIFIKIKEKGYLFTFTLFIAFYSFVFLFVFFTSISFNPIQNKYSNKQIVYTFLPQGWSFFTRNPREAQVLIYKIENNKITQINQRHSSYKNLYGLLRRASVYTCEIQLLRSKIDDKLFFSTKWNYQNYKIGIIPKEKVTIENDIYSPLLCGEYLLVFQKPIPWAWSKDIENIEMPAKVIRMNIKCK